MNGNSNTYLSGIDPLLGSSADFNARFKEIEAAEQVIAQRKQRLLQMQDKAAEMQPQQRSQTPVWDEIDSITAQMTQKEYEKLMANEEYIESANLINQLVAAMQLAQIRPVLEASQKGKDALDRHLTILKRIKKSVAAEVDMELDDFEVYKREYSDIPYSEYLKMKKTRKGGRK